MTEINLQKLVSEFKDNKSFSLENATTVFTTINEEKCENYINKFGLEDILIDSEKIKIDSNGKEIYSIVFKNGNLFEGEVNFGFLHGQGQFIWSDNGLKYIGNFVKGKLTGYGKIIWPNKSFYEGQLNNGIRHGTGTYKDVSGYSYTGQWSNGKKHGKGRLDYISDGSIYYDGEWLDGYRHGFGIYNYSNQATYEGQWQHGQRHGEGTMHWSDRDEIYTGSWSNGKQHGLGCHAWHILRVRTSQYSLPNVYDGQWENGKRNGLGTFHYPNGSKYIGYWKDNLKHGKGTFILKDGRIFEKLFFEDRPIMNENKTVKLDSIDQPSLERLSTRLPLLTVSTNQSSIITDTSDCNILEHYLKPHITPLYYTNAELKRLQNIIKIYLNPLRCIYHYYGRLGMPQLSDNTIVLRQLQFCQFIKDCKLHKYTSLICLDRIIAVSYGSDEETELQNPEKLISFSLFVNTLIILACNLFTQEDLNKNEKSSLSKPSEALLYLLQNIILPNACKLSNLFYEENKNSKQILLFLQPIYQAYQFLLQSNQKKTTHPVTLTMRSFLFILKDLEIFNSNLTPKDVVNILCSCNPTAGTIEEYNMDSELTFFDFFEALLHCAQCIFDKTNNTTSEPIQNYSENLEINESTIKNNLDSPSPKSRRLSTRPTSSRQSKTIFTKKQKEPKIRNKKMNETGKFSTTPEFENEDKQFHISACTVLNDDVMDITVTTTPTTTTTTTTTTTITTTTTTTTTTTATATINSTDNNSNNNNNDAGLHSTTILTTYTDGDDEWKISICQFLNNFLEKIQILQNMHDKYTETYQLDKCEHADKHND